MSHIEVVHDRVIGWFCDDDLLLVSEREAFDSTSTCSLMSDSQLQSICSAFFARKSRRFVPKIDFNDVKLFPSSLNPSKRVPIAHRRANLDDELVSELDSMLACREYVRKQNHYSDRKQDAERTTKTERHKGPESKCRDEHDQNRAERQQRRRQHPSYVSRFDEKRYVPSVRKQYPRP